MNDTQNKSAFQYTYSAREQEELKRIRSKYAPREENKMELLRRLDARVNMKATMASLVVGIIGTLIMGAGMSCCLTQSSAWFVPGIIIGVVGLAVLGIAYPLYNRVLRREREKIAPEILRLTDELMK